jgi:hypothetical protein
MDALHLTFADQERQEATPGDQAGRCGENRVELLHGSKGHDIGDLLLVRCESAIALPEVLQPPGENIGIIQPEMSDHLAQKSRLLLIRLD